MNARPKILIADDEPNIRRILQVAFDKAGIDATVVEDADSALRALKADEFRCLLTDVTMPGRTGYELLAECRERYPNLPVIIVTAYGTIPDAIQAIRNGAHEFVTKPFDLDQLKKVIAGALRDEQKPKAKKQTRQPAPDFIAASPAMRQVKEMIAQVADSKATVMITGESGVGKEVVAKALHTQSGRAANRFVAVSCAALPETLLESELFGYEKGAFTGANEAKAGRFELADQGTLFLDEIGEIPLTVQVKLLRALQEREFERLGASSPTRVDVRVITATNRDLAEEVERGAFRLDLLYRLKVIEMNIPPLRERQEDIVPLAESFLARFAEENGREPLALGKQAVRALQRYTWPGNVRELENAMERAVVLAAPGLTEIEAHLLPRNVLEAA